MKCRKQPLFDDSDILDAGQILRDGTIRRICQKKILCLKYSTQRLCLYIKTKVNAETCGANVKCRFHYTWLKIHFKLFKELKIYFKLFKGNG